MHHIPDSPLEQNLAELLLIREILPAGSSCAASDELELGYEARRKSRQRVRLQSGREAGLMLAHGTSLRGGDLLRAEDGTVIRLRPAPEEISAARCPDPLLLARACYHLGNRHLALKIEPARLSYPADDLADELLRGLGLNPERAREPFEPEAGASQNAHKHNPSEH